MAILISVVLAVLALAFVLYPLLEPFQETSLGKRERMRGHLALRQGRTPAPPFNHTSLDFAPGHARTDNSGVEHKRDEHGEDERGRDALQQSAYPDSIPSAYLASSPDEEREQAARVALREVELDFQLGNIEEPDYRALRERYMQRALVALKSRYDHEQELDEMIEEQLRRLKEQEQDATQ